MALKGAQCHCSSFAFLCTRLSMMIETLAKCLQAAEYNSQAGSVMAYLAPRARAP
jgi:hypothetical protein